MAFCNKCGAELDAGSAFCGQCGSRVIAAPPVGATLAAPAPLPPRRHGMGVGAKIAIGVAAAIGALLVVAAVFGIFLAAHVKKVQLANGQTLVETPFGTAKSGQPSDITARQLGIPIYPGAHPQSSVVGSFGSFQGAVLRFRTSDSPAQVLAFYRGRFPAADITVRQSRQLVLVAGGYKIAIQVQPRDGESEIVIARSKD
jgi:hypothetical protein